MMETDIKKIQNITKDSIRLLAFFEPKKRPWTRAGKNPVGMSRSTESHVV
jgi:hypothetical protein